MIKLLTESDHIPTFNELLDDEKKHKIPNPHSRSP